MLTFDPGIIVSCQPRHGGHFENDAYKFAGEAMLGGAVAVRIEEKGNIRRVSDMATVPVIGLIKRHDGVGAWITPTVADADIVINFCGADYVATDATGRLGWNHIKDMVKAGFKVIGDVDCMSNAIVAEKLGCVAVTTALAGYTEVSGIAHKFGTPAYELISKLKGCLSIPIIAEGRFFEKGQVREAFRRGVYSVCIGAAITRPDIMTEYFNAKD
jgi:N-acylglucosamine-6-phosphate 2-epimerase